MAQIEILGLYEGTPQIAAAQAGDGYKAPVTLQAATGNEVALELAYTVNKATSGNDTGLLISMTDTASPGTSLPLDIQVGGSSKFSVDSLGITTAVGGVFVGSGGIIGWDARSKLYHNGDGNIILWNNAQNNFGKLHFGGATSAFPALKRSGTTLQARLGDDSDYAGVSFAYGEAAKAYTVATLPTPAVGIHARVTDATTPAVGSTVVGGGAAAALVWYNGSNWTVIGV